MRTNKQETFIEQYCLTGNASKAAETAGYSSPKQRGYDLKKQFGFEIAERQKKMIQDCVPGALSQLENLVNNAESESVKLGAIKDVLDRAGYKAPEKIQQEISHVELASTDDLQRELDAIMGSSNVISIPEALN
jgi:phage terminase small subunit